jgi:hypothetical protein
MPPVLAAQPENGTRARRGTRRRFAGGMHFRNQAGQVRSVLSLISYLWSGQYRERYLGVKIPSASIEDYLEAARKIATGRPAAWRSPARALPQTGGSSGGLASGWAE